MAIKYGRPIEARLTPVGAEIRRKSGLELAKRPRRNRKAEWARRLVSEHDSGQFDARAHAQLDEGVAKMGVHRVHGQVEALGCGLAGHALGHDLHHREFGR